jgi:HSP90 family molecular chaperone
MQLGTEVIKRRQFYITILGRLLEHLGVQMYKRRTIAIAELVANCWDADAENVHIEVPEAAAYAPEESTINITDDGVGMNPDQVGNFPFREQYP